VEEDTEIMIVDNRELVVLGEEAIQRTRAKRRAGMDSVAAQEDSALVGWIGAPDEGI
jgi:hypothetical protein